MPSYIVVDGSSVVTETYSGPDSGAPSGAIPVNPSLLQSVPFALGCTYTAPSGNTPASLVSPTPPAVTPGITYIPAWLVRQRLAAASLWTQTIAAMSAAQQIEFATLQDGIDPNDKDVIALLSGIGANVSQILAPQ